MIVGTSSDSKIGELNSTGIENKQVVQGNENSSLPTEPQRYVMEPLV